LGCFSLALSKVQAKPLILRKFGGSDIGGTFGKAGAFLATSVARRANLYLLQTKGLVAAAYAQGLVNAIWFPNYREMPDGDTATSESEAATQCTRFVYVGQLRRSKGLTVLAEAMNLLPRSLAVDLYGPWHSDLDRGILESRTMTYKGELRPDAVIETLKLYDAFVFPSQWVGEGHPGVLVEALIAGLPIITSDIGGISEIVDNTFGILVRPGDPAGLAEAMHRLFSNPDLYARMRAAAPKAAVGFGADTRAREFLEMCDSLVTTGSKT
jgi:glycosyltransferase involved in cell wall biosynthesis